MKISVNWVRQYLDFELPELSELEQRIGAQLGAIEETEYLGDKYKGIVIAKIVSLKDHENSDHLHVVMIDDGGVVQNVARDDKGLVQVVCGANNLYEGMMVAWLPPGSVVPESYDKEPFTLEARSLRGVMSNGMLASARELALGADHSGIVDLGASRHSRVGGNPAEKERAEGAANITGSPVAAGDDGALKPGADFAETYGLNDYVIDVENKMFTHRPDCFGELGLAREIAGILQQHFTSPEWYLRPIEKPIERSNDALLLTVKNELPELVPRFIAVPLRVEGIGQSPMWLRTALVRLGLRPINNVVDITNYMMMLSAQPLHAYDYDKVKALSGGDAANLVVRYPKPDETLTLLNGKEIEPRPEAIMIATDKQLIGVGGVMGGADTEVDDNTKNIILECATFDMYSIRRTSMAHGLFTDAVARFNKGQSPLQNDHIVAETMRLLGELAGATQAGDCIDDSHVHGRQWVHPPVPVSASYSNARLGLALSADDIKRLLENVEFTVAVEGENLTVTAPFWRTDIELREDVVEEIGRLYGYDKLPLVLPTRTLLPAKKDDLLELKSHIRDTLSRSGANEVLTYSFVHSNLLAAVGQDRAYAFQVSNAISPDLQYYRTALIPSLLDKVHQNSKAGYGEFALFELGKVHYKGEMDVNDPDVPNEDNHVALVVAYGDKQQPVGAPYYQARLYLNQLIDLQTVQVVPLADFDLSTDEWGRQLTAPYEPGRSAVIVRDSQIWGVIGEFKSNVRRALKLPGACAGFEIHMNLLKNAHAVYQPLPRFPKVEQDICLKVLAATPYQVVYDFVRGSIESDRPEQTYFELEPVDIYQREDDEAHKQITLRLSIASYEKTMTDAEVAKLFDDVAAAAKEKLGAERI